MTWNAPTIQPYRTCFDIETHQFSEEFRQGLNRKQKLALAPLPRIVCAYVEPLLAYKFFEPTMLDMIDFASLLSNSTEVISFNGEGFDFLVLERHYPELFRVLLSKINSVDMMRVVQREMAVDFGLSLNKLAKLNLGVGKMTHGRSMAALDLAGVKRACQSDVKQTYEIWKLWQAGKLRTPAVPNYANIGEDDFAGQDSPGSQLNLPSKCPGCEAAGTFISIDPGLDQMSEGQNEDFVAGWRKDLLCGLCWTLIIDGNPVGKLPDMLSDLGIRKEGISSGTALSPVLQNALTVYATAQSTHRYNEG